MIVTGKVHLGISFPPFLLARHSLVAYLSVSIPPLALALAKETTPDNRKPFFSFPPARLPVASNLLLWPRYNPFARPRFLRNVASPSPLLLPFASSPSLRYRRWVSDFGPLPNSHKHNVDLAPVSWYNIILRNITVTLGFGMAIDSRWSCLLRVFNVLMPCDFEYKFL